MQEEIILKDLNSVQKDAVKITEGPLLILAGAGTGKTRTIVHRIAYMVHVRNIPPQKIIAVTFTNKATAELKERIAHLAGIEIASKMIISTFHALGFFFLRRYHQYLNYQSSFVIWDANDQKICLKPILEPLFHDKLNNVIISYFANTIGSFKDSLIPPENLEENIEMNKYEYSEFLPQVYQQYERRKEESNALDFGDMLYKTTQLLQSHGDILEELHNRYSYFLIDEYQDTNYAQYILVNLLAQKENNLCVVGDDDQSIYSWRGADIRNILEFEKDYPNASIMKLEENYRSHQSILKVSNSVIQNNQMRKEKTLFSNNPTGVSPNFFVFSSDRSEADFIASQILNLEKYYSKSDIAVLYRTNIQSQLIEKGLIKNDIPYQIFGGISFFDRKEIKDILAYLNFIINSYDDVSFLRIINTPARGMGPVSISKIWDHKREQSMFDPEYSFLNAMLDVEKNSLLSGKAKDSIRNLLNWLQPIIKQYNNNEPPSILEITNIVLEKSGLLENYKQEDKLLGTNRIDNVQELKNIIIQFAEESPNADLVDFLTEHTLNKKVYPNDFSTNPNNIVSLMTIHNAKGLEYPVIFLVGLDDDILPHYLCKNSTEQIEEERRLFYVAVTRTRGKLYMTRCSYRFRNGSMKPTKPSPFLLEIPENYLHINKNQYPSNQYDYKKFYRTQANHKKFLYRNNITSKDISSKKNNVTGNLYTNDKVKHPAFGLGIIQKVEGEKDNAIAHVAFQEHGIKKLVVKFAKLEKM